MQSLTKRCQQLSIGVCRSSPGGLQVGSIRQRQRRLLSFIDIVLLKAVQLVELLSQTLTARHYFSDTQTLHGVCRGRAVIGECTATN